MVRTAPGGRGRRPVRRLDFASLGPPAVCHEHRRWSLPGPCRRRRARRRADRSRLPRAPTRDQRIPARPTRTDGPGQHARRTGADHDGGIGCAPLGVGFSRRRAALANALGSSLTACSRAKQIDMPAGGAHMTQVALPPTPEAAIHPDQLTLGE